MSRVRLVALAVLAGVILTGCIRSSSWNGTEGMAIAPRGEPLPAPTPVPTPVPVAPPTPPLSPIIVNLDDNHRVGVPYWPDRDGPDGAHGEPVGSLECFPSAPPETYHVHSHLSIFLDGVALSVPSHIGIVRLTATSTCYYTLHTHDYSGKLHIEAATPVEFTLGEFFRIWGQPVSYTHLTLPTSDLV